MDISYLLLLQNFRLATGGVLDSFMSYITTYGEELLTMMIVAAVYWCVSKQDGMYTLFTWGSGRLLNGFLKITVCAYRPWIRDVRVQPVDGAKTAATGYSFPSGHTTNATAVYGSIAMNKKAGKVLRGLMILMVLLIGFSRNYLGVHTPQDVLIGCASTIVLLFFVRWLLEMVEKKPGLDTIILIVGLVLNVLVIIYAATKSYPMDYDSAGALIVDPAKMAIDTYKGCGFSSAVLIAWFADRRWLHYEAAGTALQRVTCYVAGILGYFVVLYVIIPLLPSNIVGAFLDRFIRLIYIMLIVPCIIKYAAGKNTTVPDAENAQ